MSPQHTTDLRDRLARIDGVDRVLLDDDSRAVVLILRPSADADLVLRNAEEVAGAGVQIDVAFRPDLRDRQRVRFVGLRRTELPENQVSLDVTLEWGGTEHTGSATGERGLPIELRTVAAATLFAISAFLPPDVPLRLAGVKQVRAFDAELIVVSVYRTAHQPRNFVGAVVMGDDPRRASAVAVLSALNRLLGNYLLRS